MRLIGAMVAFGVVVAAYPLQAQTAPAKPNEGAKIVCKEKARTGTRFTTKTCRSAADWDRMAEEYRRASAELIDRPITNGQRSN